MPSISNLHVAIGAKPILNGLPLHVPAGELHAIMGSATEGAASWDGEALLVNGFVRDVMQKLPVEFDVEAQKRVAISLEGSVG